MGEPTCRAIAPLLSASLDGELPGREAAQVADHLAGCPACERERRGLAVVRSLVRSLPVRAVPTELVAAAAARARPRVLTAATLIAVAVGLLGGAAFTLGAQPAPGPRTVHVPIEVFVADHLAHAVHGPVVTPALDNGGP